MKTILFSSAKKSWLKHINVLFLFNVIMLLAIIPTSLICQPVPIDFDGNTLYVHPMDNSTGVIWGAYEDITVGNGAVSESDGAANTSAIVAQLGPGNYAAYVCDTLDTYGFDDWYLPAINELSTMREFRDSIGNFSNTQTYWSSTEYNNMYAWTQSFATSTPSFISKPQLYRVRCIRNTIPVSGISPTGSFDTHVRVFPNPAYDEITIYIPERKSGRYKISLYDMSGKKVEERDILITSPYTISLSELKSGIYILKMTGPEVYHCKLMVDK